MNVENILIIFFILPLIINIYFLVKSIKTKNNRNWLILFSLNISYFISLVLIVWYLLTSDQQQYLELRRDIGWGFALLYELHFYLFLLILNSIFKIIEVIKNKKQNISKKTLERNIKIKAIIIPFTLIILLTLIVCGFDECKYFINVKSPEINKMVSFLNNKYDINIKESDCIYYHEQDYTRVTAFLGLEDRITYNNIPYMAVFKNGNELIAVVDRKGFISDDRQLKELNDILINYYYQKTGIKFDYIEFNEAYNDSYEGKNKIINEVLQNDFNELITDENIEQFLDYIFSQATDLSISFYIKDNNENNIESLKCNITNELEYLRGYPKVKNVDVYGYIGELDIKHGEDYYKDEFFRRESIFYRDYVKDASDNLTFSLSMILNGEYATNTEESINGWKYRTLN